MKLHLFLNEMDSISVLSQIRITPDLKVINTINENSDSIIRTATINIKTFNELWNKVTLVTEYNQSKIKFTNDINIDDISKFLIYLTNDINNDNLIIASSLTQEKNKSNIYNVVSYLFHDIWSPIANGELTLTESEWKNTIPDMFQLVNDNELSDYEKNILYIVFNDVTSNAILKKELYKKFYKGTQPIIISCLKFKRFCEKYKIIEWSKN